MLLIVFCFFLIKIGNEKYFLFLKVIDLIGSLIL